MDENEPKFQPVEVRYLVNRLWVTEVCATVSDLFDLLRKLLGERAHVRMTAVLTAEVPIYRSTFAVGDEVEGCLAVGSDGVFGFRVERSLKMRHPVPSYFLEGLILHKSAFDLAPVRGS